MKKAFTLLELILIVLVISIILAFALPKFSSFFYYSSFNKLKIDFTIIQNALNDKINSNILLQKDEYIENLDDAIENKIDEKLFTKIIEKSFLSTSFSLRENDKWIKESNQKYIYILNNKEVEFLFSENKFLCKKPEEICRRLY